MTERAIKDVIEQYTQLTPRGSRTWVGACPLDVRCGMSLHVVPERNMFHCFGCGAHGGPEAFEKRRAEVAERVPAVRADMPEHTSQPAAVLARGTERPLWYRLEGKRAVPCYDGDPYAPRDMTTCTVGRTQVQTARGPFLVSTVFLSIDHNMGGPDVRPLVFESMAFEGGEGSAGEVFTERYATWEEAEEGHARMVHLVKDEYGDAEGT